MSEGFLEDTCLTPSLDLAWYYAEAALDEDEDDDQSEVVLAVWVDISQIQADTEAMSEPVGWGGKTGQQIDDELEKRGDRLGLETSLEVCASVRLCQPIGPSEISYVD